MHMAVSKKHWYEPIIKAARATIVFLSHLLLGAVILGGIRGFQWWYNFVGAKSGLLWGAVPLEWLFDGLDFGIVVLFVFWGLIDANRAFRGED
jgi:hypothetical protein